MQVEKYVEWLNSNNEDVQNLIDAYKGVNDIKQIKGEIINERKSA
ncbi:hypothetical protein ACQKJC_24740 [Priestia koreensis]